VGYDKRHLPGSDTAGAAGRVTGKRDRPTPRPSLIVASAHDHVLIRAVLDVGLSPESQECPLGRGHDDKVLVGGVRTIPAGRDIDDSIRAADKGVAAGHKQQT